MHDIYLNEIALKKSVNILIKYNFVIFNLQNMSILI